MKNDRTRLSVGWPSNFLGEFLEEIEGFPFDRHRVHHVDYRYEDFDRIAANHAVDAVYLTLPNSMHAEHTIRAAKVGKHVICEKPMAISSAECTRMIEACQAARVKLMIAYRLHCAPITLKALDLVRSGRQGRL